MTPDTTAVTLTVILAVGAAYAGLSKGQAKLSERMARVEGIIEGWLHPPPPGRERDRDWHREPEAPANARLRA